MWQITNNVNKKKGQADDQLSTAKKSRSGIFRKRPVPEATPPEEPPQAEETPVLSDDDVLKPIPHVMLPEREQLENELRRERYRVRYFYALRTTFYTLLAVAALAVLVATLLMPVLQIYGTSMTPTLWEGDVVIALKNRDLRQGEIIAFYYNNKILVKRVIAGPGSWVMLDEDGTVFVDGKELDEPYVEDFAFGQCDLELPYQVPDERYFVMGDHRATSVDSRSTVLGCVAEEQVVGRIAFRIWPPGMVAKF